MTTTTSKATATTIDAIAADLGCTRKQAVSRLTALGYVETCGRCGGTGRYSYNTMDGDRCFGCSGSKRRLVRLTAKIAREAKARIEAGELDGYFARCKAIAAARAAVAPIEWEITAMWKGSAVSRAYTKACHRLECGERGRLTWLICESSYDVLGRYVPAVYGYSPLSLAQEMSNDIWQAAGKIADDVRGGRLDAVRGLAQLVECRDMLATLYSVATPEQIVAWGFEVPEAA